ncbi:MAG: hypothetical protein LBS12_00510 [Prevotellaceae bacterium]|nr:hypothetical protein [Prevotellaceae bacterium]
MTPNSEIYVDGLFVGTEKASVKLKRRHDHLITVKKAGCKQQMVPLDKKFQVEWVLLYMFVNVFAVATDAPTGAWYGFERSQIVVPENDCTE